MKSDALIAQLPKEWQDKTRLLSVKHIGPAILGNNPEEGALIAAAAQALASETGNGVYGPAILATEPLDKPLPKAEAPRKSPKGAKHPADATTVRA